MASGSGSTHRKWIQRDHETGSLTTSILDRPAMHAIRINITGPGYRQHVAKSRIERMRRPELDHQVSAEPGRSGWLSR